LRKPENQAQHINTLFHERTHAWMHSLTSGKTKQWRYRGVVGIREEFLANVYGTMAEVNRMGVSTTQKSMARGTIEREGYRGLLQQIIKNYEGRLGKHDIRDAVESLRGMGYRF
jgi:hypothetical protein